MKYSAQNRQKPSIYTDLALELREMASEEKGGDIDGVTMEIDEGSGVKTTWVKVLNRAGEKAIGKPVGNYVTIESQALRTNDIDAHEDIIKEMVDNLSKILKIKKDSVVLIIGLGNWNVTPDALGPKAVSKILVTRHIKENLPHALEEGVRSVAAFSPGVMGITGFETYETVKGLVERIKPDILIAIDALAARNTSRINATIQISDTGISPGAGMGNHRRGLNKESLGIPVIAIGVPTVVDAATLINDAMDTVLRGLLNQCTKAGEFYNMLLSLENEDKYLLIKEVLDPCSGNMFVTPKEVDAVMDRLSNIIANSINIALHPGITKEDINRYMY